MGNIGPGSAGYVQYDTESIPGGSGTPGSPVSRTERLYGNGISTLNEAPAVNVPVSPDGGRVSDPLVVIEASQISGNLPTLFMPNNGAKLLVGAIGTDSLIPAIGSQTTTGITRTGDNSVLAFGTQPVGITGKGQIFLADTGALLEPRPVLAFDNTAKTVTTGFFRKAHTATTGVAFPAQHQIREYTSLDAAGLELLLRTFSVEECLAGKYAWLYPQMQVNTCTIQAQAGGIGVVYHMVGSSPRQYLGPGAFTARNLSDPTRPDKPFIMTQGFLSFPIDPADGGTPSVQRVTTAEAWTLTLNNNMYAATANFDDTDVVPWSPGNWEVNVTFSRRLKDNAPTGWTQFLKQQTTAEFFAFMYVNTGTIAAPAYQAVCFHAANLFYVPPYNEGRAANQPLTEQITARAVRENGGSKLTAYLYNSNTSAAY